MREIKIGVIGLGYVGLPLARLFSTKYETVGFDMNQKRVDALMSGHDATLEVKDELPEQVSPADCREILARYLDTYDHADDQSAWFDKIRVIATDLGYAAKPKDYKKNPDDFKGHVGHVSTAVRLALTGKTQSPDIWEIQQILGEAKTRQRVTAYAASM